MSVTITRHDRIAVVAIDNPPVNALSQPVRQALWDAAVALDADAAIDAVVLIGIGRTFIAGADVTEFDKPPMPPHLPDLVARIEAARKPWIAAIHGSALGGGLEIVAGCRFRVAVPGASLGLPEVTLGLIPGAGGTVRMPRLIGIAAAIDLVTVGKPVTALRAMEIGLVDRLIDGDLLEGALAFSAEALDRPLPPPTRERPLAACDAGRWTEAQASIARRARGEIAPLKALECLRRATTLPFEDALAHERATFLALRASDQALALRHVFFAERAAPRPAALAGVTPRPIRRAAVIGGGTMGAGIAAALAEAGLPVTLVERDDAALARGIGTLKGIIDSAVARGRLSAEAAATRMQGIAGGLGYAAVADSDLVIEAVFEDLAVKRDVFAALADVCRRDAILATNTSYLDPGAIAAGLPCPERFIGLHFFSPAHVTRLLEIVPIAATVPDVLAAGFDLARRLGKVPVEAGITNGFIGNRIFRRYRNAAEALLRDGIDVVAIDQAMRGFGMAMGPFEVQDLAGLDIAFMQREAARAAGEAVPEMLADLLVRAGRKGQKTGGGWYDYVAGDRRPVPSPAVAVLLQSHVASHRDVADDVIAVRLVAEMAEEGAALLTEGFARKESDIDLVQIHGYGFPRWRGGPMHLARRRGLAGLAQDLGRAPSDALQQVIGRSA